MNFVKFVLVQFKPLRMTGQNGSIPRKIDKIEPFSKIVMGFEETLNVQRKIQVDRDES